MASAQNINRRKFIGSAAATAALTVVPRHVLGGPGHTAPSDKINIGYIGMGTQGLSELPRLLRDERVVVTCVCDPNTDSSNYVNWSRHGLRNSIRRFLGDQSWGENDKGIRAGREVGRQVIDSWYAQKNNSAKKSGCSTYADFREMLAKESGLDGVKIMTPDHLHATIALAAIERGLHTTTHKPISNVMAESRRVIETAAKADVATHLLSWSGYNAMPQIKGWIDAGAIGTLRQVHNWINKPIWPQWPAAPKETPPLPDGFNWDLWLGPSEHRPYHPNYTHAVFRGWYEFGCGILGDMGHYSLLPLIEVFGLSAPVSAEANASFTCEIVDGVSGWQENDVSFPTASTMRFRFKQPELEVFWYDGGIKPPTPEELEMDNEEMPSSGMMFVGDSGKIIGDFLGRRPRIIPARRMSEFAAGYTEPTDKINSRSDWVGAFAGGAPTVGRFDNVGAIAELVCLGAVALRTGKRLNWDSANMRITNVPEANALLHRKYRQGWEL